MAISNLVSGGKSFERPTVGAFFGKKPAASNDNVERISSDFLNNDILKSIVGAIDSIGRELTRLHDTSKSIIKSFADVIKNMRNLNRDITQKFRDVNDEINRSRLDFLRSVMMTPVPPSDKPTTIGALVEKADQKQEEQKKEEEKKEESKSLLDRVLEFVDVADTAKSAYDMLKSGGRSATRAAAGLLSGAAATVAGVAAGGTALSVAATEATKGEFGKQMYEATADNPLLGAASGDYALGAAIMHGPKKSEEEIKREQEELKDAPWYTRIYGIGKEKYLQGKKDAVAAAAKDDYARGVHDTDAQGYLPETTMSSNRALTTTVDSKGASERVDSGTISERSVDGSTTRMNTFAEKGTQTGVMMGTSMTTNDSGIAELKEFFGQRISGGFMKRDTYNVQYKGKDLELRKTEYFQVRNAVEAGDYPTAFKMLDKLALRKEREEFVAKGGKPSEFAAKQEAPSAPAAGGGTSEQQPTPPTQTGGATEGEGAGSPEKAPAAGGGGGAGAMPSEAGAGTPAPVPPAPAAASSGAGGETGGAAGTPAPATPSAPAATAGSAEGMTGSPTGTGAPEAGTPTPTAPPPPPATPEPAGAGEPIVMNSSNVQNTGSVSGASNDKTAGQNLPMNVQNDRLKDFLSEQMLNYQ